MPGTLISSTSPPFGPGFAIKRFRATARVAGVIVGSVNAFDLILATEADTFATGGALSGWANMVAMGDVAGADVRYAPVARANAITADNAVGFWTLWDPHTTVGVDDTPAIGDDLGQLLGILLDVDPTATQNAKIVGLAQSVGDPLCDAMFDGWFGFGHGE